MVFVGMVFGFALALVFAFATALVYRDRLRSHFDSLESRTRSARYDRERSTGVAAMPTDPAARALAERRVSLDGRQAARNGTSA